MDPALEADLRKTYALETLTADLETALACSRE